MRRLLGIVAFLAGGFSVEALHPLQCELASALRGVTLEPERARRRAMPDPSGAGRARVPTSPSL